MTLGRIITNSKKLKTIKFVEVTDDFSKVLDNSVPTLIIGKENAERIYGKDNLKYLDKRISDNVMWTFAKTERRNEFERDIISFNDLIIKNLTKSISYQFINIFTNSMEYLKSFLKLMNDNRTKVAYLTKQMIYIYFDYVVYGISLTDLEYINLDRERVISYLKSRTNIITITNNYFIDKTMKEKIKYSNILVPYLYFLEHDGIF